MNEPEQRKTLVVPPPLSLNEEQAVEPPLQSTIAPARPRSWGVGSTAPAWCVGPGSAVDFGTREQHSSTRWVLCTCKMFARFLVIFTGVNMYGGENGVIEGAAFHSGRVPSRLANVQVFILFRVSTFF